MPRLAANLNFLYAEHSYLDRVAAAARDGFRAVEMQTPYDFPIADVRARLEASAVKLCLINMNMGDPKKGERGFGAVPGREEDFRRALDQAIEYAAGLGLPAIHAIAGVMVPGESRERHREVYVKNLADAAAQAKSIGATVVIEPINTRDVPGFFLNRQAEAHAICRDVGAANLKVQMDLYHCQIVEGDVATKMRQYMHAVAHIQVAGAPERHEPDTGEQNYRYLLALADELGYAGWVGCEYRPAKGTSEGLGWAKPYLQGTT
ncbi:MAG TPA: 2-oxo-tetronate isomerase [Usitatibacter sp.]|nr:2-oxo-tetronate isomerase [Usitatibacter sp.]